MGKINYKKGQLFSGVMLLEETEPRFSSNGRKYRMGKFKCHCNKEFIAQITDVKYGKTTSCGCYQKARVKKANTTHGETHTRLYRTWASMKSRCYNTNDKKHYPRWGGRGITVCEEWLSNFMNFYNWAMDNKYSDGLTIDRIDNNGNYEPNNCRFATITQQARNKQNNVLTMHKAKSIRIMHDIFPSMTQKAIAKIFKVNDSIPGNVLRNETWKEAIQ